MSATPPAPKEPAKPGDRKPLTWQRISIWIIVGGIGLYLVISGLLGVIAKGG
ncbi:hypothetical protein BH09ACT4_BH09ACT4_21800 [soil metagenome]